MGFPGVFLVARQSPKSLRGQPQKYRLHHLAERVGVSAPKLVFPFLGKGVTKKEYIVKRWSIKRKSPCSCSHLEDGVLQVGSHYVAVHT